MFDPSEQLTGFFVFILSCTWSNEVLIKKVFAGIHVYIFYKQLIKSNFYLT